MRLLLSCALIIGLLYPASAQDPDLFVQEAASQIVKSLPGSYAVEGFFNVDSVPRMAPQYRGTMQIHAGEPLRVTLKLPSGNYEGIGMLSPGRLQGDVRKDSSTWGSQFEFAVATVDAEHRPSVMLFNVGTAPDGTVNELSGPWSAESARGFEVAKKQK